jgi:RNA polymerase sigma-70 factor (ECF subfamily)
MSTDPLVRYLESPSPSHFVSLVEETAPWVLGAAYRVLGDRGLAEDVTQDVYTRVLTGSSLPGAGKSSGSLLVKAMSAAMTLRRTLLRRQVREWHARCHHEGGAEGRNVFTSEDISDVRDAVEQLPPDLRSAVELSYFAGLNVSEVAQASGMDRHAVAALLQRAIKSLRTRLTASAAALILPVLEGTGQAALPTVAVSGDLAARLRELPSTAGGGKVPSRRLPSSHLAGPALVAAVAASIIVAVLGLLGWARLEGGRGGERDRGPVARDGADNGIRGDGADGLAGAEGREAAPGIRGGLEGEREGAQGPAPGTKNGRRVRDSALAGNTSPRSTSIVLRVIDENGVLLDDGTLELTLSEPEPSKGWSSREAAEKAAVEKLLVPRVLSNGNPIVLDDLPDSVLGRELVARFRWGDTGPGWFVACEAKRGEEIVVDLVVPARPRRQIVVVDASTREPIAGAFAWPTDRASLGGGGVLIIDERGTADPMVSSPPLKTDALGRCTVAGAPGMPLVMKVWADGYRNATITEEDLGAAGVVGLEPRGGDLPGSLAVRVIEGGRWARRGAWVEIIGRDVQLLKDADPAGRLVFEKLEPGQYVVKLADFSEPAATDNLDPSNPRDLKRSPNEDSAFVTRVRVRPGEEAEVTLGRERARSTVTVNVVDQLGRPREGVKVSLGCLIEGFHAATDAGGRAVLEKVPPEECLLAVGGEGWSWKAGKVSPEDGEPLVESFVLGRGVIRGRVLAPAGKRLPRLVEVQVEGPLSGSADVAADGTFEIEGALPGSYRVTALEPGHVSEPVEVIVPHAGDVPTVEVELSLEVKAGAEEPDGDAAPRPGRS